MHILGVPFLFIGFVLILNALWLQEKIDTKDVGIFNLIVGLIAGLHAFYYGWALSSYALSAGGLLFAITYLWVGINATRGAENQTALGYYCLLVAIITLPFAYMAFINNTPGWTLEWLSFGVLWYLFYELLAKDNTKLTSITALLAFLVGVEVLVTGFLFLFDSNEPIIKALGL